MWVQIDADPFKEGSTELCVSESKKKRKENGIVSYDPTTYSPDTGLTG